MMYIPGPTARTVFEPAAIWVLPASCIILVLIPSDLAVSCNCVLKKNMIYSIGLDMQNF